MTAAKPEKILSALFVRMLSAEDMRRVASWLPGNVDHMLPGATASTLDVAGGLARAVLHDTTDLGPLWQQLLDMRPRRRDEIERARADVEQALRAEPSPAPTRPTGEVRVLFVSACPFFQDHLAVDRELREIHQELDRSGGRFTAQYLPAATYRDLRRALRKHKPHILHIACHGTDKAELLLATEQNQEDLVAAATLAELLALMTEEDDLGLVVLNACHSAKIFEPLSAAVDLVIGMQRTMRDSAAIAFSSVLYESLVGGDTVEKAFQLAVNDLRHRSAQADVPALFPAEGPQRQRRFA